MKKTKIPLMCLTGKMKQFRREEVFMTFCRCKSAVLFCTDLAARGLDFPMVHWVVQYDCPESPQTYIHRAGRSARAGARGVSLVFLTPRETPMLSYLHQKSIPLREVAVRPEMLIDTKQMFVALAIQGLKLDAQKACIGYLRSLHFASNKEVFDLSSVDTTKFAQSLGLNAVPDLSAVTTGRSAKNLPWEVQNFMIELKRQQEKKGEKMEPMVAGDDDEDDKEDNNNKKGAKEQKTRRERHLEASDMFATLQAAQRFNVKKKSYFDDDEGTTTSAAGVSKDGAAVNNKKKKFQDSSDDEQEEELFTKRRLDPLAKTKPEDDLVPLTAEERLKGLSKHKQRRLVEAADLRVKDLNLNTRIKYDEDDEDDSDDDDLVVASTTKKQQQKNKGGVTVVDDAHNNMDIAPEIDSKEVESYASQLKSRVKSAAVEDKQKRRERKFELLEKKGLVAPRKKDDGQSDDSEGEEEYDDGQSDDDSSSDGSLDELLRAAKGELYDDDENEDDEGEDEDDDDDEEEEIPVSKNKKPQQQPTTKSLALGGRKAAAASAGAKSDLAGKRQPNHQYTKNNRAGKRNNTE